MNEHLVAPSRLQKLIHCLLSDASVHPVGLKDLHLWRHMIHPGNKPKGGTA